MTGSLSSPLGPCTGSGDLNSGPEVCMSSTLTTEPSSLLCIILYKSYLKSAHFHAVGSIQAF